MRYYLIFHPSFEGNRRTACQSDIFIIHLSLCCISQGKGSVFMLKLRNATSPSNIGFKIFAAHEGYLPYELNHSLFFLNAMLKCSIILSQWYHFLPAMKDLLWYLVRLNKLSVVCDRCISE